MTAVDTALSKQIEVLLGRLPDKHSAAVAILDRPIRAEADAQAEVPAASTIKLPLMIATYRLVAAGQLSATQRFTVRGDQVVGGAGILQGQVGRSLSLTELLETTLTYSDNTGANMLIEAMGGLAAVNATMAELGYRHTHMRRVLMDVAAQERGLDNTSSAADLADMLARIDRSELVSPEASAEMLRVLRLRGRETDPSLDYLGRQLVPRPMIAHLNGTLARVRNDAGIVEIPEHPFVLVVLLHDLADETAAEDAIARTAADIAATLRVSSPRTKTP